MATAKEMRAIFNLLVAAHPGKELGEDTPRAYEAALGDLPVDLLKAAVLQCLATSKWFPTIAEVRGAAADILARAQGHPTALEAWGQMRRWLRSPKSVIVNGQRYVRRPLTEPSMRALAALGGEGMVRESDNPTADRARFEEAYNGLLERERGQMMQLPAVAQIVARLAASGVPPTGGLALPQLAGAPRGEG
jgi:hypothetical protein